MQIYGELRVALDTTQERCLRQCLSFGCIFKESNENGVLDAQAQEFNKYNSVCTGDCVSEGFIA